ncbi:MAG TPA: hypothetical protein VI248_28090 [Kineosporiaceae bacterium]
MTDELPTPDGRGRFNHFDGGASIYWTSRTGARLVKGAIRDEWARRGWERSALGYPVSDEGPRAGSGERLSRFEHGEIRWTPGDPFSSLLVQVRRSGGQMELAWRPRRLWDVYNVRYSKDPVCSAEIAAGGIRPRGADFTPSVGTYCTAGDEAQIEVGHPWARFMETAVVKVQGCTRRGILRSSSCGPWQQYEF